MSVADPAPMTDATLPAASAAPAPREWADRSVALERAGRRDAAAIAYRHALRAVGADPRNQARVHVRIGRARLAAGDAGGALEAFRQALLTDRAGGALAADDPIRCEWLIDYADACLRLGLADDATRAMERASQATRAATLARLAATAFRFNLWQPAIEVLRRCVALHPTNIEARWNLANGLSESWQLDEALAVLASAETLGPVRGASSLRASVAARRGDPDGAIDLYREVAAREGATLATRSSLAMAAMYSGRLHAAALTELHRRLFSAAPADARSPSSFRNDRTPDRRLRVGFVTSDLHRQHPIDIFLQPLLDHWDREAFETTLYYTGASRDERTLRARGRVHRWIEATALDDATLARRIEADGIDVLVDLSGHTSRHRLGVFARRAAPVQVTYLGYPGTTGMANMDWIVADPTVAPDGSDGLFTERVLRMPHAVFCYAPGDAYPSPAFPDSDATRPLTFGSFNNATKLNDRTLDLWARVLQALPESRLLLKAPSFTDPGTIEWFTRRLAARDIASERVTFRGPTGLVDMMAEYADVDVGLDPVPFNGGTTTLQAMWMGVPVLCLEGDRFSARMSAGFMRAAGLGDWVAGDEDELVAIALRVAADRRGLLALRRRMRDLQRGAPAWDPRAQARALGEALRTAWRDACAVPAATPSADADR